jgi:HD-GYP domain-containing protein (c-di-GMP phosphodiesterase class II)
MQQKTKTVLILAAGQAACLAAGIWIQQCLLSAVTARRADSGMATTAPSTGTSSTARAANLLAVHLLTFSWIAGLQGLASWLLLTRMQGEQDREKNRSVEESLRRARELVRTRDAVIFGLAKLAESRDPDTGHHLERIALYSTRLASALRRHPKYHRIVTTSFVRSIGISSALHDIGKVGVEDSILLKPGPLTAEERKRIEGHTGYGGDCIRQIQQRIGDPTFLEMACEIALHHHERWDGTGYPDGLCREQIPLAARIVSIADVYDALSVRRVYKAPLPHEACVAKIRSEAGKHFDPDLVDVFLSIQSQFSEIADRFVAIDRNSVPSRRDTAARARDHVDVRMTDDEERLLRQTLAESEGESRTGHPVESLPLPGAAARGFDADPEMSDTDLLPLPAQYRTG